MGDGDDSDDVGNYCLERFKRFEYVRNIKEGDGMFENVLILFNC